MNFNKPFLVVLILLGIVLVCWSIQELGKNRQIKEWPQVKGKITAASFHINHRTVSGANEGVRWYGPDVQYEYSVGLKKYTSRRLSFQDTDSKNVNDALQVMNKYRKQPDVNVYYNPKNPDEAVLRPERSVDVFWPLMAGVTCILLSLILSWEPTPTFARPKTDQWRKAALLEYTRLIETYPQLSTGYANRGALYFHQGLYDLAIADLDKAVSLDPQNISCHEMRAKALDFKKLAKS